jgi:flagellar protein FliL
MNKNKIIIGSIIAIVIIIAGITVLPIITFYFAKSSAENEYGLHLKEMESRKKDLEIFKFTEEFKVNTADKEEPHILTLKLELGYEKDQKVLMNELSQREEQFKNIVYLILSQKNKDQIEGIDNHLKLKEEIKASLNHLLSPGKIKEIFIIELNIN